MSIAAADPFGKLEIWYPDMTNMSAYLTGGVDYLSGKVVTTVLDDLAERIFDSRIVAVDEVPVHELHCERGFA